MGSRPGIMARLGGIDRGKGVLEDCSGKLEVGLPGMDRNLAVEQSSVQRLSGFCCKSDIDKLFQSSVTKKVLARICTTQRTFYICHWNLNVYDVHLQAIILERLHLR